MTSSALRSSTFVLLSLASTLPVLAGGQPVDLYWADRWNAAYHRFTDADQNGSFNDPGEVGFYIDRDDPASFPASALQVFNEDGQDVAYWLVEFEDTIVRGVDLNGDGLIAGGEITVFRDSVALDGNSWPQDLVVTQDGGVWWAAGLVIANPQNGLSRLEDLNGDGDAADPGEQIVMVDGTGTHFVEHDEGTSAITSWAIGHLASAGNGVIAHVGDDDQAVYRFEDLNGDGDVLDAGESVLLINATGENAELPMNPDFQDGTLKSMSQQNGYYARFVHLASGMENGERAFYFGTDSSEQYAADSTNVDGAGVNYLIFRGVDGNGDRDVNDAGEVTLFVDGSYTDGDPNLLTLRCMDVLDGGLLYAGGVKPYPVLAPGPNGNTWIHRFEDLNGDGDARDPGEQQLEIFDLQVVGPSEVFPIPPSFGNVMADPWDISVRPRRVETSPADLDGDGQVGFTDLTLLLGSWGTPDADLDGDGTTGFTDLTVLLGAWGP